VAGPTSGKHAEPDSAGAKKGQTACKFDESRVSSGLRAKGHRLDSTPQGWIPGWGKNTTNQ
jgi:hypothetical protein